MVRSKTELPPLPRHPSRGLRVEAGDSLTISNLRFSLHDLTDGDDTSTPLLMEVPAAASEFESGAAFALQQPLKERWYNVNEHQVRIRPGGRSLAVLLKETQAKPFRSAYEIAEKTLDLLAADSFGVSELDDPLREYCTWSRSRGETLLRCVTTGRLAGRMDSTALVRDATGKKRSQPSALRSWHASHAYFRRSQVTDHLHEAYRNLFLALEALLSEVYPWSRQTSEKAWLKAALKRAAEGYEVDLSQYVGGKEDNPYQRFVNEQYHVRRCALFHAKLSEKPTIPSEPSSRQDLVVATRRLGKLYKRLARSITGAGFTGGVITNRAFAEMMKIFEDREVYLSPDAEFSLDRCIRTPGELTQGAQGEASLHQLKGRWRKNELSDTEIRRGGSLLSKDGELIEGSSAPLKINPARLDVLELILQTEFVNEKALRNWFL